MQGARGQAVPARGHMAVGAQQVDRAVLRAERESLFLARLALLLFEQVGDEARCRAALADALHALPVPSLSAS